MEPYRILEQLELKIATFETTSRDSLRYLNITSIIQDFIDRHEINGGHMVVQTEHTTTTLILNENERGLIRFDLPEMLLRLIPEKLYVHDDFERRQPKPPSDEPKNASSHLRVMSIAAPTLALIVNQSKLVMGQWQSIIFLDTDACNRTTRRLTLSCIVI